MDDRLVKALDHANYIQTVFQKKQELKARLENLLTVAHNGGTFTVSENLISFVSIIAQRDPGSVVLIDNKGNPIEISNIEDFLDDIISVYFEATNEYLIEYNKLKKARNVAAASKL